jgi:hypothetical protein
MAISEPYTNSATIGVTPFSCPNNSTTLTPITVDGVYQVFLDTAAVAFGDKFLIQILEKVTSAGTQRVIYESTVSGVMSSTWVSPSLILLHGWDVQLTKLTGTDRSISWSIRSVA